MAHFRGTIQGHRGEASRLGSANSGLHVTACSWQGAVYVDLSTIGGVDMAYVRLVPHNGRGVNTTLYEGPVSGGPRRATL